MDEHDSFRRTLKFDATSKTDLQTIKEHTGATTDTAAVNEAVRFRARYANYAPSDVDLGLWLLGEIKKHSDGPTRTVVVESKNHPSIKLAIPSFG